MLRLGEWILLACSLSPPLSSTKPNINKLKKQGWDGWKKAQAPEKPKERSSQNHQSEIGQKNQNKITKEQNLKINKRKKPKETED
jgi:hypothetical protein